MADIPIDRYTLRARIAPGLLAGIPVLLVATAWSAPSLSILQSAAWTTGVGLLSLFVAQFVRDAGASSEVDLFSRWDGPPTTRFLRHRDTTLDIATKQRYHARLALLLADLSVPTARHEADDPAGADQIYASCVAHLRERTRDRQAFPVIHEANIDYGFRRNLWGIKPFGLAVAMVGAGAAFALGPTAPMPILCALGSTVLSLWWAFGITADWVATAADAYAVRLLAACETVQPKSLQKSTSLVVAP